MSSSEQRDGEVVRVRTHKLRMLWAPEPATEAEVAEMERVLDRGFPPSYREFLLRIGRSGPAAIFVADDGQEFPLDRTFAAASASTLLSVTEREELPPPFIVIGNNFLGDPFIMDLSNERVYYRNYSEGSGEAILLAESFLEFVQGLMPEHL